MPEMSAPTGIFADPDAAEALRAAALLSSMRGADWRASAHNDRAPQFARCVRRDSAAWYFATVDTRLIPDEGDLTEEGRRQLGTARALVALAKVSGHAKPVGADATEWPDRTGLWAPNPDHPHYSPQHMTALCSWTNRRLSWSSPEGTVTSSLIVWRGEDEGSRWWITASGSVYVQTAPRADARRA